jgi:hypothetical protein
MAQRKHCRKFGLEQLESRQLLTVLLSEDFDPIDSSHFSQILGGTVLGAERPGEFHNGNALYFNSGSTRQAILKSGLGRTDSVSFRLRIGDYPSTDYFEGADYGEGVSFEASTDSGATWHLLKYFDPGDPQFSAHDTWGLAKVPISNDDRLPGTLFRWAQHDFTTAGYDTWAIDEIVVERSVNHAPVLQASQPSFGSTVAGLPSAAIPGISVAQLLGENATDADDDPLGIAVVGLDSSAQGTYQYSRNGGADWLNIPTVSQTSALLIPPGALIRFVPAAGFVGTAKFDFRAWDKDTGVAGDTVDATTVGGTSTLSAAVDQASFTVRANNRAPVLTPSNPVAPSTGIRVSSLVAGHVSDGDANQVGIAVVGLGSPAAGKYQFALNGSDDWVTMSNVSESNARLLPPTAMIRFVPNPGFAYPVEMRFRAWDQSVGAPGGHCRAHCRRRRRHGWQVRREQCVRSHGVQHRSQSCAGVHGRSFIARHDGGRCRRGRCPGNVRLSTHCRTSDG